MQNRHYVSLKGQTAGYVSRKASAVCVSWVTAGTLAVPGHRVGDTHWTSWKVFHLIGPVPVTALLFRPVLGAVEEGILSPKPTDNKK